MCGVMVLVMSVCRSVILSVTLAMAASNSHNSETTSSITTKRGIWMGSVAFSGVILLKSLSKKHEAKKCGDNTVDLHVCTYQQVGNRAMNKYYSGDYMQALRWHFTVS